MSIPAFHGSASDLARSRPSVPSAGFSFPFRGGSCRGALAENASASRAVEPSSRRASTFFYESPRNLRIPIGFQGFQLHLQFDILRFYNQLHFCSRILILLCSFALSTPKRIRSKAIAPCKRTSTWPFLRTTSVPQRLRQFSRATWIVSVYSFLTCHNLHIPFQRTCSVLILFKAYQSEAWRILEDLGGSWRLIEDWLKIDWRAKDVNPQKRHCKSTCSKAVRPKCKPQDRCSHW